MEPSLELDFSNKEIESEVVQEVKRRIKKLNTLKMQIDGKLKELQDENGAILEQIISTIRHNYQQNEKPMMQIKSMATLEYPANYIQYQLLSMKHKIGHLNQKYDEEKLAAIKESKKKITALHDSIEKLQAEKELQLNTKTDLEVEWQQMIENNEKEKIQLKKEFAIFGKDLQ